MDEPSVERRHQLREAATDIICEVTLLKEMTSVEDEADRQALLDRLERDAYALGSELELAEDDLAPEGTSVGIVVWTTSTLFDGYDEQLDSVTDAPVEVTDRREQVIDLLESDAIDRLIVDAVVDGEVGLRRVDRLLDSVTSPPTEAGLLSVYDTPAGAPHLGFAGVLDAALSPAAATELKALFELDDPIEVATVGPATTTAEVLAGATGRVTTGDTVSSPDIQLIHESSLETMDADRLHQLRGITRGQGHPVFIVLDASSLGDGGYVTTVGADGHLVRPPTAIDLLGRIRDAYEKRPSWMLDPTSIK